MKKNAGKLVYRTEIPSAVLVGKLKKSEVTFFSVLRPILVVAKIFGVFPVVNVITADNISVLRWSSRWRGLAILYGFLLMIELAVYMLRKLLIEFTNTEHILQIVTGLLDRLVSIAIYLITIRRGHLYVAYFQKWQSISYLLTPEVVSTIRTVTRGYLISWFFGIIVNLFVVFVIEEFSYEFLPGGHTVQMIAYPIVLVSRLISIVSVYYVSIFYSLMALFLAIAFQQVNAQVRLMFERGCGTAVISQDICRLRFVHQEVFDLVEETNSLLSPLMMIDLSTQTIILCSLIYRMIVFPSDVLSFIARGCYSFIKIVLLMSLCINGGKVSDSSKNGLSEIYSAELDFLSPEARFQVHLMEAKLGNRKASLNASGFTDVNRSLLLQIFGVVVTYVLVMVQFKEDEK